MDRFAAGEHTLTWRPQGPAGLYLLRVQDARGASDVRKLFLDQVAKSGSVKWMVIP